MFRNNGKPMIDLENYAKLLDETYLKNETLESNCANFGNSSLVLLNSHHSDQNCETGHGGEEQFFSSFKQLHNQQLQFIELSDKLTSLKYQAWTQKMNSLIATGSSAIQQLQTELAFVNKVFENPSQILAIDEGPTLPLNRSAQRAFVETISLLTKLCNSLEENVELLKNASSIDWEAVEKTMETFLRSTKTFISESKHVWNVCAEVTSNTNKATNTLRDID